jgi:streptogramin lyase
MPLSDQDVIERLHDALDAPAIPQHAWSDRHAALQQRATNLRRRRGGGVAAVSGVAVAAVIGVLVLTGGGGRSAGTVQKLHTSPSPVTSYAVTASARVDEQGGDPQFAIGHGAVFVADWSHGRIVRLNSTTLKVTGQLAVGSRQDSVLSIAYGHGSLWALDFSSGTLLRIDPTTMRVAGTTPMPGQPSDVVYGDGSVWVTVVGLSTNPRTRQRLERINPATGDVTGHTVIPGSGQSEQIAVSSVVAVSGETGPIMIVDPTTMRITRTMHDPGEHPAGMSSLNGQIYVLTERGIVRLSTADGREPVVFKTHGPDNDGINVPDGLSGAAGLLWAGTNDTILGIDPALGDVVSVGHARSSAGVATASGTSSRGAALISNTRNGVVRLTAAAHG